MEDKRTEEYRFIKAKEKVKKIKGFYAHLVVTIFIIPVVIFINLKFVPEFHWFWIAIGGISFSVVMHWLSVFGFDKLGFGKDWEDRKIKEFMNEKR
ncbi:histidine kinase [Tenacibaculum holothuriorum]|uniref:Histidine kinase n=1 Tax=Tenacibaculum holothuriorum TaxID=1635173 RepID=A0A1Y2PBG9_9FLAO|nr:2TM domain-containing protein [Tenacibaculum holothuriorum]OSY87795.1 histidine kinase [Tenacibaculum holothuriorum]